MSQVADYGTELRNSGRPKQTMCKSQGLNVVDHGSCEGERQTRCRMNRDGFVVDASEVETPRATREP